MDTETVCNTLIVKLASRCNINCTYCYMYNRGDDTYQDQPKIMTSQTIDLILEGVRMYAFLNGIDTFYFTLHGGEPLLAGPEIVEAFVRKANQTLAPEIRPVFKIQTNGILINDEWCALFDRLNIHVGVSLDGTPAAHDKYRIDHKGKGTYHRVVKGLKTLQAFDYQHYKKSERGVLTVIDVNSSPIEVYQHFKELQVKRINLLLPDHNYDHPPAGKEVLTDDSNTIYADWLISIFDCWFNDPDKKPGIPMFKDILHLLMGAEMSHDYWGNGNLGILIVETDGGIEPADSLKICGNAFTKMGMNIRTDSLDDALNQELSKLYGLSKQKVARKCTVCPVREICGGGFFTHRYSSTNGFNNPSVYCADLLKLITYIQNQLYNSLPDSLLQQHEIVKLTFEEARRDIENNLVTCPEPDYIEELESFRKK